MFSTAIHRIDLPRLAGLERDYQEQRAPQGCALAMITESVHYLAVHYLVDKCFIAVPLCAARPGLAVRHVLIASARYRLSIYIIPVDIAPRVLVRELFCGVYEYGCWRLKQPLRCARGRTSVYIE